MCESRWFLRKAECSAQPPSTPKYSLWGCNIGDVGLERLAAAVRSAPQIETLE
jgi:hypothetical protein